MSKRTKNITFSVAALVVVLGLASPKLKLFDDGKKTAGAVPARTAGVPVAVHVLTPEKLTDKIVTTGTILANEEVDLRSEISGKIIKILFQEGSKVRKGDLLFKIDDVERQAQLRRLEYQRTLVEAQEFRQRALLQKEAASQEEYDIVLNELNKVKADLEVLQAELSKTEIRAPFDGVIGLRYVSEGSYISPATRIAQLVNFNPIKIDFAIPEKYAGAVAKGAEIVFKIGGSERQFQGKIFAIEPKIDTATRTVQVRALCSNDEGLIIPGAFAQVELVLQSIDNAIMIPSEALVTELRGQRVYLYRSGKAMPQIVGAGIRTGDKVQITSGVQPGDTVITTGLLQLRPGAPVTIAEFAD